MAKCFDVTGYIEPCNTVRQKYSGRALLITGIAGGETISGCAVLNTNGVVVERMYTYDSFSLVSGFVSNWNKDGGKALPVMIDAQNPLVLQYKETRIVVA